MRVIENIKLHFRFGKKEIIHLVIASLSLGFFISFRDWGDPTPLLSQGVTNWINSSLVVFFSLVIVTAIQKLVSLRKSHLVEFKVWSLGLLFGLIFVIITNGSWLILLPGGLLFSASSLLGVGNKYEGRILHHSRGIVAFFGPFVHILLAYIFKYLLDSGMDNYLVNQIISLNMILAITTILPIPQFESLIPKIKGASKEYNIIKDATALHGFYIFYDSRIFYIFSLAFILILLAGLSYLPIIASLIIGGILAGTIALIYLFGQEL